MIFPGTYKQIRITEVNNRKSVIEKVVSCSLSSATELFAEELLYSALCDLVCSF